MCKKRKKTLAILKSPDIFRTNLVAVVTISQKKTCKKCFKVLLTAVN